jgi:hypothetical protein
VPKAAFGNDPWKTERYRNFWSRADVARPLVGFSLVGWFPFEEFAACRSWGSEGYLTPDRIEPAAFLDDHIRVLREGERIEDDLIRGACPALVAIPWLAGTVGCRVRILPKNALGEEQRLSWDEAMRIRIDDGNPWFRKYLEFAAALVEASAGEFPVSHTPENGPTDLHAALRGHAESILDLVDEPERSADLLAHCAGLFLDFTRKLWSRLPLFCGGYFDAQYSLWAPGPIARMQEDATAVFSPALYRKFVQPVDRMIASVFPSSFMHLHSTSMFLLDDILEVEEIRCFEVNNDVCGPPVADMVPHFRKIQSARRPLLIRGSFTPEEMRLLMDSLDPCGLFLNIMVSSENEIDVLRPLVGM